MAAASKPTIFDSISSDEGPVPAAPAPQSEIAVAASSAASLLELERLKREQRLTGLTAPMGGNANQTAFFARTVPDAAAASVFGSENKKEIVGSQFVVSSDSEEEGGALHGGAAVSPSVLLRVSQPKQPLVDRNGVAAAAAVGPAAKPAAPSAANADASSSLSHSADDEPRGKHKRRRRAARAVPAASAASASSEVAAASSSTAAAAASAAAAAVSLAPPAALVVSVPPYEPDLSDMRAFLLMPAHPGVIFKTRIVRDRTKVNRFHPRFFMYLEHDDGRPHTFLMGARKRKKTRTASYVLSLSQAELGRTDDSYIGKLRANFAGTEFAIYDEGDSPDKDDVVDEDVRSELGSVCYLKNVQGRKGPRQMRALLPGVLPGQREPGRWTALTKEASLLARFQRGDTYGMHVLESKQPVYNEELKAFTLNFNKRVTRASVKNFQIVFANEPDAIVLQFGRCAVDEEFILDFQYPVSPLQAFAMALTSVERKLGAT